MKKSVFYMKCSSMECIKNTLGFARMYVRLVVGMPTNEPMKFEELKVEQLKKELSNQLQIIKWSCREDLWNSLSGVVFILVCAIMKK